MSTTVNDRPPNVRSEHGRFYLLRCFACDPQRGRENYAASVYSGVCAWCSWAAAQPENIDDNDQGPAA